MEVKGNKAWKKFYERAKSLIEISSYINKKSCYTLLICVFSIFLFMSRFEWRTVQSNEDTAFSSKRHKRSIADGEISFRETNEGSKTTGRRSKTGPQDLSRVHQAILNKMEANNIKNFSKHYSSKPHSPGSRQNEILAEEMLKQWKEFGFDKTEIFKYKVLLSFPRKPTEIHLRENSKLKKKIIVKKEPPFGSSEKVGEVIPPYFAFSVSGNISAPIVYCNYGTEEDYDKLKELNIAIKNRILMVRNGGSNIRDDVINNAIKNGALALLYYSDPADFTQNGSPYPDGEMLNGYGVERRNAGTKASIQGELLSDGYPSKQHYFRNRKSSAKRFQFDIPLQPISAINARTIFKFMSSNRIQQPRKLPKSFEGGLNISYSLESSKTKEIFLDVDIKLEDRNTSIVCGSLFGSVEPDRYVIVGNHRDAWVYGASDPVSGSAVLSEIVKAIGEYKKRSGYKPRRSLMACSWGAEEMGILGSKEWADENQEFINRNTIAYLNIDAAVDGNYSVDIKASDEISESLFKATRLIPSADNTGKTLYEEMQEKHAKQKGKTRKLKKPEYSSPGLMSDNVAFSNTHAKAAADYRYTFNPLDFPNLDHVMQYHTRYDSFDWMEKFIDPDFRYHLVLGRLCLAHVLILLDSELLPFNLKKYVIGMKTNFQKFKKKYYTNFVTHNISLEYVDRKLNLLSSEVSQFKDILKKLDFQKIGFNKIRAINDILMNFGRKFLLPSEVRFSNLVYNTMNIFSGIDTAISDDPGINWNNVRKEITYFMWCIDMARKSLDLSELRI